MRQITPLDSFTRCHARTGISEGDWSWNIHYSWCSIVYRNFINVHLSASSVLTSRTWTRASNTTSSRYHYFLCCYTGSCSECALGGQFVQCHLRLRQCDGVRSVWVVLFDSHFLFLFRPSQKIFHWFWDAWAANSSIPTIIALDKWMQTTMGQRTGIQSLRRLGDVIDWISGAAWSDIKQANLAYNCPGDKCPNYE